MAIPFAAQNAGYTSLVFHDDFDGSTLSSQWSKHCWFLAGDTNSDSISLANSILTLFGGSGSNGSIPALIRLTSAIAVSSAPYYSGLVFRHGGYFEASLRFDPSASGTAVNRPAFWSLAIEHIHAVEDNFAAEHWPGQASNYYNYAEFDFAEAAENSEGTDHYLAAVHNWNGLNGANDYLNKNFKSSPATVDWTVFHTYGALWIPQGSNAYGKIEYYYDGVLINSVYYKGPADDITATSGTVLVDQSTAALAGLPFSVLDRQGVAISLQADVAWKLEVDWVHVWQTPNFTAGSLLGGGPVRVLRSIPAVPLVTSMVSPAIVSVSRDVAMITVEPVRVTHDVAFVNLAAAHVPLVVAETYGPYVVRVEVEPEEVRHVG